MRDLNSIIIEGHVLFNLQDYLPGEFANNPDKDKTGSTIYFHIVTMSDIVGITDAVNTVTIPCVAFDNLADALFNVLESRIMEPVKVRLVGYLVAFEGKPTIRCEHIEYKPTKSITL